MYILYMYVITRSNVAGEGLFADSDIKEGMVIIKEEHLATAKNFSIVDEEVNNWLNENLSDPGDDSISNDMIRLLSVILRDIRAINKKYGVDWTDKLYSCPSDRLPLTLEDKKSICQLAAKYNPEGGMVFILKVYSIVVHNYFKQMSTQFNAVYACLDFICSKLNHACNCNCHYLTFPKHTLIIARRNISKGEELTINYGSQYFEDKDFKCNCGSCGHEEKACKSQYDTVSIEVARMANDLPSMSSDNDMNDIDFKQLTQYNKFYLYGIETWYILLQYLTNLRSATKGDMMLMISSMMLATEYLADMTIKLSKYYNIPKSEVLACFMSVTQCMFPLTSMMTVNMVLKLTPKRAYKYVIAADMAAIVNPK